MNIRLINDLNAEGARDALLKCCGSERWAELMTQSRPFGSEDEVIRAADQSFAKMTRADWLEAFAAHPKIGNVESLRKKYADTKTWAQSEQSGVNGTSEEVLQGLAQANKDYEEKFGHIFIVCATGKTAEEMLSILNERLRHDLELEFGNAAAEQKKITLLRLEKL